MRSLSMLLVCLGLAGCAGRNDAPAVDEAWIRAAPPSASARAAYAVLRNPGDAPLVLRAVSGEPFGTIELHETRQVDGMMRMRRVERLSIPPRGEVRLQPGGLHLMLLGATRDVDVGERVVLRFEFEDGTHVDAAFEVRM